MMTQDGRSRLARIVGCAVALVIVTFLFAWFVGGLIPAPPRQGVSASAPDEAPIRRLDALEHAEVAEVAFGEAEIVDSSTLTSDAFDDSLIGDVQATLAMHGALSSVKAGDPWRVDMASLRFQVVDAKVVDKEAFEQWYPHYADMVHGFPGYEEYEAKYVVVKAAIGNVGEEAEAVVLPWLWSSKFSGADFEGLLGIATTPLLIEEMQGTPQESSDTRQYVLEEGWNIYEPGRTRDIVVAFPVYRSLFSSEADFDDAAAEDFALQFVDCDPARLYRFALG